MSLNERTSDATIKFPELRRELILMAEEDQREISGNFHRIKQISSESQRQKEFDEIALHCHIRAKRMLEILDEIEEPTIQNIGEDGCEAVLLLAQHSYLSAMKRVASLFEQQLISDPKSVPVSHIPALKDKIMILETRKQKYGTQWEISEDGVPFLVPVKSFEDVNRHRAKYGLKPVRKPVNLAIGAEKYPLGRGLASASDQKELTEGEYQRISRNYLQSMV